MKKYLLFILIILLFASCKVISPSKMFQTEKDFEFSEFQASKKEYIIQPFDKLNLKIYTNDGFRLIDVQGNAGNNMQSRNVISYLVEYDGKVKVPTLGRIKISGLTIRDAEQLLEKEYSQYYKNPFVIINVTNRRIIVFSGGSSKGSVLPITNENFTLIEALAQAGGIDNFSKSYKIKLIRGNLNAPQVFLFNVSDLKDMKKANFLLQANDIIYVETRPRYASKILVEIAPYMSLLTTILLIATFL
ncbi:MAG: polysaccharide biosynthesis/export family protein [Bacteroidales bacterium]|nr:polysaccharide biosynthesis/export family protein [Bacteroidales bacterium]